MEAIYIEVLVPAILLGLITSFHCVGMCGPIALSLGVGGLASWRSVTRNLTYQFGRIVTYSTMGLVFGAIGSFSFGSEQRYLSIAVGILMIAFIVTPKNKVSFSQGILQKPFLWVKMNLGKLLSKKTHNSLFSIGLLNGLLPCGPVYIALAASFATGDIYKGTLFMAIYGLGTVPLMFLVVILGNKINLAVRSRLSKVFPILVLLLGLLFILRGMSLGIPYVSPKQDVLKIDSKECCH